MDAEKLGRAIDRLDSLAAGLAIPLEDSLHVGMLREILPEVVAELKAGYVELTGDNPWE